MSEEEVGILKELEREQEAEARRVSEKFLHADLESAKKENISNGHQNVILIKEDEKTQGNAPRINIFAERTHNANFINIFDASKKSVNLFNLSMDTPKQTTNIFNQTSKPLIATTQEEDELSVNSELSQSQKGKEFKSEPEEQVMKYEYKNQMEKIKTFNLRKFKCSNQPTKDDILMSLEFIPEQKNILHLVFRAKGTKICFYQRMIVKGLLNMENFMGKEENLQIKVIKQKQNEHQLEATQEKANGKCEFESEVIKVQFLNVEESQEFKKMVNEYFDTK